MTSREGSCESWARRGSLPGPQGGWDITSKKKGDFSIPAAQSVQPRWECVQSTAYSCLGTGLQAENGSQRVTEDEMVG